MTSATIRLFLVHGDPKRLRVAELSNWTGKAVSGPRTEFEGVLGRDECGNSGIYLLTGTDPESGKPAIYIGEAECIRDRVKSHNEKDFWNQITFFVSKDENLTKAHIRYLEGKLLEQAKSAGRAVVTNSQASGSKLPESDRAEMEVFLEKMSQLLPVLGIDLLVPMAGSTTSAPISRLLYCEIKGLKATGFRSPNGFLVQKASEAVASERPSSEKWPWTRNLRQKLKDDGVLEVKGDRLVFVKDMEFASPSAAAAVIHGGHANGLTAWKDANGRTLKELEVV
ncbi:MAG TPA: GIY-YIG nuclease family protein [Burkholderiaceae bacterium]|nr:GIY-YIG nuclease family protein [Burkholderiaceae bacterium]